MRRHRPGHARPAGASSASRRARRRRHASARPTPTASPTSTSRDAAGLPRRATAALATMTRRAARAAVRRHRARRRTSVVTGFQREAALRALDQRRLLRLRARRASTTSTDSSVLERAPLEGLAGDGQLRAFRHTGFWDCMDTYKDAITLNDLWADRARRRGSCGRSRRARRVCFTARPMNDFGSAFAQRTAFVTGAYGMLGYWIVRALLDRGARVVGAQARPRDGQRDRAARASSGAATSSTADRRLRHGRPRGLRARGRHRLPPGRPDDRRRRPTARRCRPSRRTSTAPGT